MTKKRKRSKQIKTLLDIVILVYGRFDLLTDCLEALANSITDFTFNVILIDNNSPNIDPGFYQKLKKRERTYVYLQSINLGFPKGCNLGAKKLRSPLLLFLNSDVIVEPNALQLMVNEMRNNPKTGVVGMRLKFPDDTKGLNPQIRPVGQLQHIGLLLDICGKVRHAFMGWDINHPKVMKQRDVFAVTGAALMTRRKLWNKIGGFDEGYGLGSFEDVDFCRSIAILDQDVVVVPDALGTHYTGASVETYNVPYPLEDNYMRFIQKWKDTLVWSEHNIW